VVPLGGTVIAPALTHARARPSAEDLPEDSDPRGGRRATRGVAPDIVAEGREAEVRIRWLPAVQGVVLTRAVVPAHTLTRRDRRGAEAGRPGRAGAGVAMTSETAGLGAVAHHKGQKTAMSVALTCVFLLFSVRGVYILNE